MRAQFPIIHVAECVLHCLSRECRLVAGEIKKVLLKKLAQLLFFQRGAEKRAVQYNMFFSAKIGLGAYHFSRLKNKSFDRKKIQLRAFQQ